MHKKIRVLHFTTHDEECGIAKYQAQFIEGMSGISDVDNEIFEVSPNKTKLISEAEFSHVLDSLVGQMENFDILHIQHELSFFSEDDLLKIVKAVKSINKKILVTIHTAPSAQYKRATLDGYGPHSIVHYQRTKNRASAFLNTYVAPLKYVDLIVAHNQPTKDDLVSHGIDPAKIQLIKMPVPVLSFTEKTNEVSEKLRTTKQDVIFCTVGFISDAKGVKEAVKALRFLPDNYKLAIVGGGHPSGANDEFYNDLCDLIIKFNLEARVYITGYIQEDDRLNALIRECDICVYPYDAKYYSYVSSAALSTGIANHKPTIAYPTRSFIEINAEIDVVKFCQSPNYYELAREILDIDVNEAEKKSEKYAQLYNWNSEALKFVDTYRRLAS